jgi:superfamily II DNA or RNA helicase
MPTAELIPVVGCWVVASDGPPDRHGQVTAHVEGPSGVILRVNWIGSTSQGMLPLDRARCGFMQNMDVLDVPDSRVRPSLGMGRVRGLRTLGQRQQVLVDFQTTGRQLWVPYERLRFIKGAEFRFKQCDLGGPEAGERFRLRALAHALSVWNQNTGALSHFDIDPLPHQIHLVHHILASGNLNWLIADDVGLGKTIETGLLIAALAQRQRASRVLLVVPSGLTRQWQEDLRYKFGMIDFEIHGRDFDVHDPVMWKLHDKVIGSLDRLKDDKHLELLMQAKPWDLIVFDEAHRLSRRQYGMSLEASDRFRLAEALRTRTDNLVFLTATPHQGMQDKFIALLGLLRPQFANEFQRLDEDSSILGKMVFRNRKADVTDIDGNFIFNGQTSIAIAVDSDPRMGEFDRDLKAYLQQGFDAAGRVSGMMGRAIGFVMTVYRKLAASSVAAIERALIRRMERIRNASFEAGQSSFDDGRFEGEFEERQVGDAQEFFAGEQARIQELLLLVQALRQDDRKLAAFMERIIAPIRTRNAGERVLIFSEYRATQDYLCEALEARYGVGSVALINGSMNVDERREAIRLFEEEGRFLLSTEAGGEGINLQRFCHILVNYDLPWNPMRLAQRVGRLYRYGQRERVVAFNLQGSQTADEEVIAIMYTRLSAVARDMAVVGGEYSENLHAEILGELADILDVEEILEQARNTPIARTAERIDAALQKARDAADLQRELFSGAASYDRAELQGSLSIGPRHLAAFITGMLTMLDCEATVAADPRILRIRLSESVHKAVAGAGRIFSGTTDRSLAQEQPNLAMLDMTHPLVIHLLDAARAYDFQGLTAPIEFADATTLVPALLRWQNDSGQRMREELSVAVVRPDGQASTAIAEFSDWLLYPAVTPPVPARAREAQQQAAKTVNGVFDDMLTRRSNEDLHPENMEWIGAATCVNPPNAA